MKNLKRILVVTLLLLTLVATALFTTGCGGSTKLGEIDVETVAYDGEKITWGYVENATKYILNINGSEYTALDTQIAHRTESDSVTVEITPDASPIVTSHKISSERYLWQEVSLDGISSDIEARSIIENAVTAVSSEPTHLRLDLVGTLSGDVLPELTAIEATLADKVRSLELRDNTLCLPEGGYLERDTTLRGEFYRSLLPELMGDDSEERNRALRALKIGLAAIDGKDFTDGGIK